MKYVCTTFHLGRTAAGEEAIALIGIDAVPPADMMETLEALPQVRYAKVLTF